MKNIYFIIVFLLLIHPLCRANTSHTEMRDISTMDFVQKMQVGWNLGNTLDAYGDWISGLNTETCWGNPFTTKAMIDEISNMGFKTMRLPVTWRGHFDAQSNYTIDKEWLDRVEEIANYAFENDMYVIINIHHDEPWVKLNATDKDTVEYQLNKIWTQIAERFITYGDYLVFETLNEPRTEDSANEWTGGTEKERIILNDYHKICVDAIRATGGNNASRKIMVSTYAASSVQDAMNSLVIPNDDANIIVSIHSYFPYAFCLGGTDDSWGTDADKNSLDRELDRIYNKFVVNGIAVVLGEWCNIDNDNYTDRLAHAEYYTQACAERNLTPIWWDTNSTSRLLNRNTLEWVSPELIDVLISGISAQVSVPIKTDDITNITVTITDDVTVSYQVNKACSANLNLISLTGQVVGAMCNEHRQMGLYTYHFDSITDGVYVLNVQINNHMQSFKLLIDNSVSDLFIEDGSYLRIKNIALKYTLPKSLATRVGVENACV